MAFLVRRFVAGRDAPAALPALRDLNRRGISATLDFLGEECRSRDQASASVREYENVFKLLAGSKIDSNVSLKLTQLGLNLDSKLAEDNLRRVLDAAAAGGNFVRVDMEGSAYTQRTLDIFYKAFETHKNVGIVIQAYLRRSAGDVAELIRRGARVRLCKGAYKEPSSIAFQDMNEINRNYDELASQLVTRGHYPAIATHDDGRINAVLAAAQGKKESFEFQMLYGVRPRRWDEIVAAGYKLRIYVPYGTHWFPYYYRRIRERKENLLFALRSVLGV